MGAVRVVISSIHESPEAAQRILTDWAPLCAEVRKEPGCIQFEFFRSADDPGRLVLMEAWDNYAHYDQHHQAQLERRIRGEMPPWPNRVVEFYRLETYDIAEGVWQPADPENRLNSVRFA